LATGGKVPSERPAASGAETFPQDGQVSSPPPAGAGFDL
jgi:hypothetical protein